MYHPATSCPVLRIFFIETIFALSLSSSFPFVKGQVLPATSSPPHLIVFSILLPSSCNSAALFGSLSSAILSTCPAHCSLLLTRLSVKLLCSPVYSLNSTFLLLSSLFTFAIFRTQLFSNTYSLCCYISVSANVSVPCRHAGVTQVLMIVNLLTLERMFETECDVSICFYRS